MVGAEAETSYLSEKTYFWKVQRYLYLLSFSYIFVSVFFPNVIALNVKEMRGEQDKGAGKESSLHILLIGSAKLFSGCKNSDPRLKILGYHILPGGEKSHVVYIFCSSHLFLSNCQSSNLVSRLFLLPINRYFTFRKVPGAKWVIETKLFC